jgi:hypothetical protein
LRQGQDIWQSIASLKRVAQLAPSWIFPGSARVRSNPGEELGRKIAYYEALGEQVLLLQQRGLGVAEIVRRVCGGPMWIELITLGHFARRRLVLSYLGQNVEA